MFSTLYAPHTWNMGPDLCMPAGSWCAALWRFALPRGEICFHPTWFLVSGVFRCSLQVRDAADDIFLKIPPPNPAALDNVGALSRSVHCTCGDVSVVKHVTSRFPHKRFIHIQDWNQDAPGPCVIPAAGCFPNAEPTPKFAGPAVLSGLHPSGPRKKLSSLAAEELCPIQIARSCGSLISIAGCRCNASAVVFCCSFKP